MLDNLYIWLISNSEQILYLFLLIVFALNFIDIYWPRYSTVSVWLR